MSDDWKDRYEGGWMVERVMPAAELLNFVGGPEMVATMTAHEMMLTIWKSQERPDIKPGRHYRMTLAFKEDPYEETDE